MNRLDQIKDKFVQEKTKFRIFFVVIAFPFPLPTSWDLAKGELFPLKKKSMFKMKILTSIFEGEHPIGLFKSSLATIFFLAVQW